MKKVITYLTSALSSKENDRASARKLSAFMIMACVVVAHFSWIRNSFLEDSYDLLPEILIIDFTFISVALGLTTVQEIIKLKNGIKENEKPKSE